MTEQSRPAIRIPTRPPRVRKPRMGKHPRAPFLPKEPHPHGWLAKKKLKAR